MRSFHTSRNFLISEPFAQILNKKYLKAILQIAISDDADMNIVSYKMAIEFGQEAHLHHCYIITRVAHGHNVFTSRMREL
jgi:hypothetical protein